MSHVTDFLNSPPDALLNWLPIIFFGAIVFLLWKTIGMMPRVKTQAIKPQQKGSRAGPTSPASRK